MDVFVSIIPWHHISFVWVIVAGAQNNDVCRAFFARWMPLHVSVCWNHTARFIVIFSGISTYLKSWQVVSHQIQLPGVQWLKHLFIYLCSILLTTLSVLFTRFTAGKPSFYTQLFTPQLEIQEEEHRGTPTAADLHHPAGAIDHGGAVALHQYF